MVKKRITTFIWRMVFTKQVPMEMHGLSYLTNGHPMTITHDQANIGKGTTPRQKLLKNGI
ncbi:hypothetical protein D3C72_2069500 [compost metagenome]